MIIFLLSITILVYYNSNNLIKHFIVHSLRNKDAFRSCSALISLGDVSFTFGCSKRKLGVDDEGGYIVNSKKDGCWNLELSHLHIGNAHGWQNENTPYALHLNKLRVSVSGPLAFLSLLQLPLATSPMLFGSSSAIPRIFCNGLDFFIGFRIRSIDTLEIRGLSVFYFEGGDSDGGETCSYDVGNEVKTGLLWLKRGHAKRQKFQVLLGQTNLSWYELKQGIPPEEEPEKLLQQLVSTDNNAQKKQTKHKQKGSIKLFPSSSVEVLDDEGDNQQYGIELISDTHCLILHASSIEERDAWVRAFNDVIAKLRYSYNGGGRGNTPWLEVLIAESNGRKLRWRRKEKRQRYKWHLKWQSNNAEIDANDEIIPYDDEDVDEEDDDDVGDDDTENEDDNKNIRDKGSSGNFLSNIQRALDGQRSHTRTKQFEDAMEWRIGRLEIQQVNLHINDRTHIHLDESGWGMNGFIGSSRELRSKLRIELGAKLLQDSTGHAIKWREYEFGDITKTTLKQLGAGVCK